MTMSAWMLFAAPFAAHSAGEQAAADMTGAAEPSAIFDIAQAADPSADIFAGDDVLSEKMMKDAAGGTSVAVDISNIGVNVADQRGLVKDLNLQNTSNGQIANNAVNNNSGITTVFNNTGNGVVFQSSVQVNIFLDDGGQ